MNRSSTLKLLAVMVCAAGLSLAPGWGQGVDLGDGTIQVNGAAGPASQIIPGNIFLGSNGLPGNLFLLAPNGTGRISFFGNDANVFLGGGNADGDVHLTDTDGLTTTIDLDGEFGLVTLGSVDDDGDLWVMDNEPDGLISIGLDGGSGNVTNQLDGNGLVKAWARINANGTVQSCWRCDPSETLRAFEGWYYVNFGPLGVDVRARPRLAVLDAQGWGTSSGQIDVFDGGPSSEPQYWDDIGIHTRNSSGDLADRGFTMFVF